MIYDRFIFIVIASISFLVNSMAVEAKASISSKPITTSLNRVQIESILTVTNRSNNSDRQPQISIENPENKESLVDESWGLVAIAIVSIVCFMLLKLMFIPPSKVLSEKTDLDTSSKAIENKRDRDRTDIPHSLDELKDLLKLIDSTSPAISSASQGYVTKEIAKFEPTNQLKVLNSDTKDVVELIKYLQQPDEDLRREAIRKLAREDFRGIEPLIEILPQVSSPDRSLILKAIIEIIKSSLQPIEDVLFSNLNRIRPEAKQNAIHDLAVLYTMVAPIVKQLAQMQVDRNMQVQQTAEIAIEQLNFYLPCLFDRYPNSAELRFK